ncbi:tyrosine-type recombinase/integrase [Streptococcus suis]
MTQKRTKYTGVYKEGDKKFFYQTELGIDKVTGKRIRVKSRKDQHGRRFTTAADANRELTRIKKEYHEANGYSHYNLHFDVFMRQKYIPYYKTTVKAETYEVRHKKLEEIADRFAGIPLRKLSIEDVHDFRTWLLTSQSDSGAGYSQSYASLVFGMFRKALDFAVGMNYVEKNISKQVKAIAKGKAIVEYWTKTEFEAIISHIFIEDVYEHLSFVMLWLYFMTGIRVNEGCALKWSDIDFNTGKMRVHNMLIFRSKKDWYIQTYTKSDSGNRIIMLDDDTLTILKNWRDVQLMLGLGGESDFIFSYDGHPMVKSTIGRIITRYAKLANVKRIQPKGLRHSHASYLINEFNVSVLILSKRMGHSSPEITLRHYSHMWGGADEAIVKNMKGNINIVYAENSQINFNGNQNFSRNKLNSPPKNPPKQE